MPPLIDRLVGAVEMKTKKRTVHHLSLLDRESEQVAVVAEVYLAVHRLLFSKELHGLLHRDQASVCVFPRKYGSGGRIALPQHDLPCPRLDAIAPHNRTM